MRVAVICEYSGTVRDAFIREGYEAVSFDIIPSDSDFGEHVIGDVVEYPMEYWEQFDLAICHPPCTYLSVAGAKHLYKGGVLNEERYKLGLEATNFFNHLRNLPIERIAVENPLPFKIFDLGKYDQIVHPYYFGEPYQKRTCLWLKNLPKLESTNMLNGGVPAQGSVWFETGGKNRQKNRAKTFKGIAEAMAKQWGGIK